MRSSAGRRLILLDGVAAAVYLLLLPTAVLRTDVPSWQAISLMLAVGAPVALRRVRPVPVLLLVLSASVAAWLVGALVDPFVAAAFALYPVALTARRSAVPAQATGTVAGVILAGAVVAGTPVAEWRGFGVAALGTGLLAASWTAGRMVSDRRAEAARATAELTARAVAEERLRIARELHDVVAHSMSLIAIKAGTANHVMSIRPGEAQDALRVIETTSRTALTEMRQLLGVLRAHTPAPPSTATSLPSPPPFAASPSGVSPAVPTPGPVGAGAVAISDSGDSMPGTADVGSGQARPRPFGFDASRPAPDGSEDGVGLVRPTVAGGAGWSGSDGSEDGVGLVRSTVAGGAGWSGPDGSEVGVVVARPTVAGGSWQEAFGLGPAELAPAPGTAALPALAGRAEEAGVRVEMTVRGVDRLPDGIGLSVYRIVQEALTNVVRHAAPAACRISVVGEGGEVRVDVTDDGPGTRVLPATGRTGHGLIGMRERVLMYGGQFHAGPRAEGGFGVSARIPCEP